MSETMVRFTTHGIPEIVIIDKQGNIRARKFGSFDSMLAEEFINNLLAGE